MDEVDVLAQARADAQVDGMAAAGAPVEVVEHLGGDWQGHRADARAEPGLDRVAEHFLGQRLLMGSWLIAEQAAVASSYVGDLA